MIKSKSKSTINFNPFTTHSLSNIKERILNEKTQREFEQSTAELNHLDVNEKHYFRNFFKPKQSTRSQLDNVPDTNLEAGKKLPKKYISNFPADYHGIPLEEVDDFYKSDYTFIVINKNHQIYRFSAQKALCLLDPFSQIRRFAIYLLTHSLFSIFVMITILINCVFMALPHHHVPEMTENIFTLVYTFEALLKILARGFLFQKFSFLRDPWNWLDFIVIFLAYATMFIRSLGNLSVLRTLRVLRALKTVAIVPGLKTIVDSLIQSVIRLRDVIILTSFVLSVFALVGLQLYMGVLKRKCVWDGPNDLNHTEYAKFISNSDNWVKIIKDLQEEYVLCGNNSGAMKCPKNSTCLPNIGQNPNNGYTNFDSYPYSMLNAFRLMTQDYWENLYQLILTAEGPFQVIYFIVVIFFGSFYLINLILAIVALSYKEQQIKAFEEAANEERIKALEMIAAKNELEKSTNDTEKLNKYLSASQNHVDCIVSRNGTYLNKFPISTESNSLNNISSKFHSDLSNLTWNLNTFRELNRMRKHSNCLNTELIKLSIPFVDEITDSSEPKGCHLSLHDINYRNQSVENFKTYSLINSRKQSLSKIQKNLIEQVNRESKEKSNMNNQNLEINNLTNEWNSVGTQSDLRTTFEQILCYFQCIPSYEKIQKLVGFFILDAFVDLFITICIVVNTLFLALDHHNMNQVLSDVLTIGNYVFTVIFTLEVVLKIIALSPKVYLKNKWNIFDVIIVTISLIELGLDSKKMLVLRSFRLLRVFKLAKSWPTLNQLMSIIGEAIGALGNLTFVLGIIVFIFAVMGNQLFGNKYVENKHLWGGELPRWNFVDFFHSFMIVFRVLCGEWIESMWDCLNVAGWPCVPFFLVTMIVGNLVVLNLFLALLLSSFGVSNFENSNDNELSKIQEALNRIKRFFRYLHRLLKNKLIQNEYKLRENELSNNLTMNNSSIEMSDLKYKADYQNSLISNTKETSIGIDSKNRLSAQERDINEENKEQMPLDCCPLIKIKNENELRQNAFFQKWTLMRRFAFKCVEHKYFELFIIVMILLSSVSLAIEDNQVHFKPRLKYFLEIADKIFTLIFFIEVVLKCLAYGCHKYFTDGWCWLDFVIVMVALMGIAASLVGLADIPAFKAIRTLRALRPLRAMSRFDGIRVVVNALIGAIPSIFNVLLVCLVFWLIFSIMGVQLFAGRFYKCVYKNHSTVPFDQVKNMNECLAKNYTWTNSRINFDNVLNAYLALLQVATFKGWIDIMADASDISYELNQQPRHEQSIYMLLYFVFFIIFGSFFTLNLFIGVIIDNFNQQKKKIGSDPIDLFMTEEQKKYFNAMKKMRNKKPQKALPRPRFPLARFFFDLTSNQKFDVFIMICILLNMVTMCAESYGQSESTDSTLTYINNIFIVIFTIECLIKLIALNWRFFKFPWNVFDITIVILSLMGIVFEEFIKHILTFSPTILRVIRVVRVGRILRLVKGARGIRTLLFALAISMPALVNIGLLLFLVIFIYSIFGMNFFMYVKYDASINELFNFENIYRSIITLFPLCTSAGWSGVLKALTNDQQPFCDPKKPTPSAIAKGNCGNSTIAIIFLVSYLIISFLVVVNMYIAVILENFSQAREEIQQGLTDDDYDMYYEIWQKYDPHGTEFIRYDQLSNFVHDLEHPLGIPKPNERKLITFDLVICENDLVHCLDILDALTKNFLGTSNEIDQTVPAEIIKKDRPKSYKPKTSTLKLQRENYCAKVITKAIRKYVEQKKIQKNKQKYLACIDELTLSDNF